MTTCFLWCQTISAALEAVLQRATTLQSAMGDDYVSAEHLLQVRDPENCAQAFRVRGDCVSQACHGLFMHLHGGCSRAF